MGGTFFSTEPADAPMGRPTETGRSTGPANSLETKAYLMNFHQLRARMIAAATATTLGLLSLGPSPLTVEAQEDAYHILLTNDDGVRSPGILALASTLSELGEVHVIAPCGQRSGSSMSVTLREELAVEDVELEGVESAVCVDTTPAGVALLAIRALAPEGGFDLVVSGINAGANVGEASHMSGTIGAAMAGAMHGIPAVAASANSGIDLDYAARFVARFAAEARRRPPNPGIVYSINIPHSTEDETRGVAVAPMLGMHFTIGFEEEDGRDGIRRFRTEVGATTGAAPGGDTEAFLDGWITITPLRFDWTAREVVDDLRGWGLTHEIDGR